MSAVTGTITAGNKLTAAFSATADTPFSVTVGASATGVGGPLPGAIMVLRSYDSGSTWAPIAADNVPGQPLPLQLTQAISVDLTELETGVEYALILTGIPTGNVVSIPFRIG